jgi:hypothetical protein
MGVEYPHTKVKLVIPILFSSELILAEVEQKLLSFYGKADFQSKPFLFMFTNYYQEEMGETIWRKFIAFETLIAPDSLADIKKTTNQIEIESAIGNKRKINLDPGYLELGKFVLATTKDQQHRLYIRDGIYEEITLYYRDKGWRHWEEWTYPDYRSEEYKTILTEIREIYKRQLKNCI